MIASSDSPLPYRDTKPQGAADFYFAINATFRFIADKLGPDGWVSWLRDMAADYYRPVWEQWRRGGLDSVARYLDAAFAAEPGAVYRVLQQPDEVVLEITECPALKHLRAHGREIVPFYCQHCQHQFGTMAGLAGLSMALRGGNGSCTQVFSRCPVEPGEIFEVS